jgi:chaperone modulatory protein CbpM
MASQNTTDILTGRILENETRISLRQLCDSCAVHPEYIIKLVDQGFIEPSGIEKSHWFFSGVAVKRVMKAKRLQHDLGINFAGVALALELLEEIEYLRAKLGDF